MREIVKKVFYESSDIDDVNYYIKEQKLNESDIINIVEIPLITTHFHSCSQKIILFHYKKLPKYLIRPDDYCVFSLNEDNETYSIHKSKEQFPNNLHNKYKYEILEKNKFFIGDESKFDFYESKSKEYHRNLLLEEDCNCDGRYE